MDVFTIKDRLSLLAFFLLALLPVWVIVPMHLTSPVGILAATLASTLAPSIAALAVTASMEGRNGLRDLRVRAFHWRVDLRWIFLAVAIPIICGLGPILVLELINPAGYIATPMTSFSRAALYGVPVFALLEEFGWMGFAMPRLQQRLSPLVAALVIGLMQGLYHLPVFVFNEVHYSLIAALIMTISFRVSLTWIYNLAGGSILIAAVYHTFVNLSQLPTIAGVDPSYVDIVLADGFLVGAVLVLAFTGRKLGRRQPNSVANVLNRESL